MIGALFLEANAWPLLLLAPAVWLVLAACERLHARRTARAVGPRLDDLAPDRRPGRTRLRRAVFAFALLLAFLAVMGPAVDTAAGDVDWRGVDVVLCLDVSRSMLAGDADPNRLGLAKREIRALAERAQGDRLGLVVFAGQARLVSPLTSDTGSLATLADLAHPTDVARGGTDLGAALDVARAALAGRRSTFGAVVLLTDGEDLAGRGRAAAGRARDEGIVVHAVGYGSARGSKINAPGTGFLRDPSGADVISALDAPGLARIAHETGGRFVAGGGAALVGLYEDRILPMARAALSEDASARKENAYQWPLAGAFLLWVSHLALATRRRP